MADISFIIGSGFSIPAKLPSASQLNKRFSKIDASEICVHTSELAWFLNGQNDPNAFWMGIEERNFIQKFLEFYNSNILRGKDNFDYEEFYDFYDKLIVSNNYPVKLHNIFKKIKGNNNDESDLQQMLLKFDSYFNQLIKDKLSKKFKKVHHGPGHPPKYWKFLSLLEELKKKYIINIHSLNHDLFFETLASSDSIEGELDDGFEENGSPYYGKLEDDYEDYNVRLSRFTNKYVKKFRLFKLHGSIDHYWVGYADDHDLLKFKSKISLHYLYKEIIRGNNIEYLNEPSSVVPVFLSGKESKIKQYYYGDYYPKVFKHFVSNLEKSSTLIIIGYGFRDDEINNYIVDFMKNKSKKIFVIGSKNKPKHQILNHGNVIYQDGGVENIDYEFILNNVI